jgi:hypothetical protein
MTFLEKLAAVQKTLLERKLEEIDRILKSNPSWNYMIVVSDQDNKTHVKSKDRGNATIKRLKAILDQNKK